MRMLSFVSVVALTIGVSLGGAAFAQHGHGHGAGHNHQRFDDPARWSKSFDDPARDAWQKPEDVIRALALKPSARVADVGAGTGYFTVRLARAVPEGTVFAVDVERKMVEHIASRAKEQGLANVRGVVASETAANLPEAVDLVLMVNSFHHIEARAKYMQSIAGALREGGRVAIVEARLEAEQGPPKHFRMSITKIDEEMKAAGFVRVGQHDFLPRQNLLVYERAKT